MTQLENLKNQIKELEKSCDEARDRIKNENLPFLNIYENRAAFFYQQNRSCERVRSGNKVLYYF